MKLDVSKAFLHPMDKLPFSIRTEIEPQEINGETVFFSPVTLEGSYIMMDDTVRISAVLNTTAKSTCAVCLSPVEIPLTLPFEELFTKTADPDADDAYIYVGKAIDLDIPVLTCILLALPMRFVCPENCAGSPISTTEWDEAGTVWAQEDDQNVPTYRPFENLGSLLEDIQKKKN